MGPVDATPTPDEPDAADARGIAPDKNRPSATTGTDDDPATTGKDVLRLCVTVPAIVTLGAGVIITVVGEILAIPDAEGDTVWGNLPFLGPILAGIIAVLQPLWRPPRTLAAFFGPLFLLPLAAAVLCSIASIVVWVMPSFQSAVAAATSTDGFHYWFDGGAPWPAFLLVGYAVGLIIGLIAFLVVSLPVIVMTNTREFVVMNMLDRDPQYLRRNRISGIALSLTLLSVFGVPSGFVFGYPAVGWIFVVLGVASCTTVVLTQRVDRRRRAEALGDRRVGLELPRTNDKAARPDATEHGGS